MTKQQKEVALLKKEIRKLERDKRILGEQLHQAKNGMRYWQREYNRVLDDMNRGFNAKPKVREAVNPDPVNKQI